MVKVEVTLKSSMSKMQNDRHHRHSNEAVHVKGLKLWLPLLQQQCVDHTVGVSNNWCNCHSSSQCYNFCACTERYSPDPVRKGLGLFSNLWLLAASVAKLL